MVFNAFDDADQKCLRSLELPQSDYKTIKKLLITDDFKLYCLIEGKGKHTIFWADLDHFEPNIKQSSNQVMEFRPLL
jgi:hypothetical protein